MPKLFPIHIEVEEVALGSVIRQLNRMAGVAKFNLDLDDDEPKKKANGHAPERKPRRVGGLTGEDFLLQAMLAHKKPMISSELGAVFEKDGRSPGSIASVLHNLKKSGYLKHLGQGLGYKLAAKGIKRAKKPVADEAAS